MLHYLLDEHLSPRIAKQFQVKCPAGRISSVLEWQGARLSGVRDEVLLTHAHQHKLTLVTYDQATIIPLLRDWAEQGIAHSGVIFIDDQTIAQGNFGGIVRALVELWEAEKNSRWRDRVIYLTRATSG
jgi:hypothetical protein